jgi:periplasmic divalent cation tolerance protein
MVQNGVAMAYSLILSTASAKEEAQEIARTLVERKLVACVNIVGPIESIYRWKGEVENSQEFLLLIKTESGKFEAVREAIQALHSYEVPEVVQIPIENGLRSYLTWITESVGSGS